METKILGKQRVAPDALGSPVQTEVLYTCRCIRSIRNRETSPSACAPAARNAGSLSSPSMGAGGKLRSSAVPGALPATRTDGGDRMVRTARGVSGGAKFLTTG